MYQNNEQDNLHKNRSEHSNKKTNKLNFKPK